MSAKTTSDVSIRSRITSRKSVPGAIESTSKNTFSSPKSTARRSRRRPATNKPSARRYDRKTFIGVALAPNVAGPSGVAHEPRGHHRRSRGWRGHCSHRSRGRSLPWSASAGPGQQGFCPSFSGRVAHFEESQDRSSFARTAFIRTACYEGLPIVSGQAAERRAPIRQRRCGRSPNRGGDLERQLVYEITPVTSGSCECPRAPAANGG